MHAPPTPHINYKIDMTAQIRPQARRGPSGAWSRLKPAPIDPLQTYGLPSKGETRLNDFKAQETFYNKIVERYMKFCAAAGSQDLERQFAALSIASPESLLPPLNESDSQRNAVGRLPLPGAQAPTTGEQSPELQLILMAMRKLRESIVAIRRRDVFAQRCYIFIVKVAILVSAWESYLPALTYLLHDIHPVSPLDISELTELVKFQVLDYVCRLGDFNSAYLVKAGHSISDRRLNTILRSLARDDWISFWRVRKKVDGYWRAIMGFAETEMRLRALKCLGKTYFNAEKAFVEATADQDWAQIVASGVKWELTENDTIVIRRAKAK